MRFSIRRILVAIAVVSIVCSLLIPFSWSDVDIVERIDFPETMNAHGRIDVAVVFENTGFFSVWYLETHENCSSCRALDGYDCQLLPRALAALKENESSKKFANDHKFADWKRLDSGNRVVVFTKVDITKFKVGIQLKDKLGWTKDVF